MYRVALSVFLLSRIAFIKTINFCWSGCLNRFGGGVGNVGDVGGVVVGDGVGEGVGMVGIVSS